jgi:hypothetical protein
MGVTILRIGLAAALLVGAPSRGDFRLFARRAMSVPEEMSNLAAESKRQAEPTPRRTTAALGTWGGEHVRLESTEHGGNLEFDCARGSIEETIAYDDRGRFAVKGTYVRQHPGPIRVGREPGGQPATYSGEIHGSAMTLRVALAAQDEPVGTYSLTHGQAGKIRKCR